MRHLACVVGVLLWAGTASAGQAWYNSESGRPYHWKDGNVGWVYDPGDLSKGCSNACAIDMLNKAFSVWAGAGLQNPALGGFVATADIHPTLQGKVTEDLTKANYAKYIFVYNTPYPATFVLDYDGSIVTDLCSQQNPPCDPSRIMAWTILSDYDLDTAAGVIRHGVTILNGPQYDAQGADLFYSSVVHEIGHLLGLDHTGLGDDLVTVDPANKKPNMAAGKEQGIPTMYPIALVKDQASLHKDDVVAISQLYPKGSDTNNELKNKFCMVTGKITDANGKGIQGLQVQAQSADTNDMALDAVSTMTGVSYPIPSNDGHYYIYGLVPKKKYTVFFAPLPTFSSSGSSIGNWDDPVTNVMVTPPKLTAPAIADAPGGICVSSYPSCFLTAAAGATKEVYCDTGGQAIVMDAVQLKTATIDDKYSSAPTPTVSELEPSVPAAASGKSGCSLIR